MFRFPGRPMQRPKPPMQAQSAGNRPAAHAPSSIDPEARKNAGTIQAILQSPEDLIVREFTVGTDKHIFVLVCMDGLIDQKVVNESIIHPIQAHYAEQSTLPKGDAFLVDVENDALNAFDIERMTSLDDALLSILSGETALFSDGSPHAVVIGSRGYKTRPVLEPQTETIIRGPREAFTEDLRTNTALMRRRLRDPRLRFDSHRLGTRSKRDIVVMYIEGIVNPQLTEEVTRRIKSIDIDDVEGSGYVEQFIADSFLSPFPLILNTERPDKMSAAVLQGRIGVLVDGDPFGLVLPITFDSCIQSPEDYYQHWLVSTLTRILRMMAAFLATFLPALYIALLEYHHGMLPTKLAFSIAGAREGVPFPAVVEAFAMEATLELLREAGLRLPKPIGQTIGIVGGLVIGEAAVTAGIVSPIMVIVVAITAIASFSLPSYSFAISLRVLRFSVMMVASILGLYGIVLAYIVINVHLVNLRSFGIPYSTPFAPTFYGDWKDLILRAPITMMKKRPTLTQTGDKTRLRN
jgi:spore germination protein